ncbi:outer membrane protein assembly factor BamC [Aquabacterium lacunae]|uniref:Outer membrane protein assembly factor BamC n=1 Tax=Aquabacterium lacunae TaxID=2528630 RepID=A0A4Q9H1T1_9BURK|nr:outer membrane protein assembly factor BamC [Aquabacterium lacunae]TBO33938.1 outer membrane protein assembly factor BamC [Aquabacterium lacunae]
MLTVKKPGRLALIASACALSLLQGCSTVGDLVAGDKVDYRSSGTKTVNLEVPPDLSQLSGQARYTQSSTGAVSATAFSQAQASGNVGNAEQVAQAAAGVSLERDGQTRWLKVNLPAEQVWPLLREFWQDNGFELPLDQPAAGLMETNWKENRVAVKGSGLRDLVGRVFDNLYDSGERDQFRTRVERTAKGTEIYISHRGMIEIYTDARKESTTWKARPSSRELEAEMLSRLVAKLGAPKDKAAETKTAAAAAAPAATTPRARVVDNGLAVAFAADNGDQAWRRVGLALDRGGFTVEDRDRTKGFYEVRLAAKGSADKPGLFERMGNWFSSKPTDTVSRYRLQLTTSDREARVTVLNGEGKALSDDNAREVIRQLGANLE